MKLLILLGLVSWTVFLLAAVVWVKRTWNHEGPKLLPPAPVDFAEIQSISERIAQVEMNLELLRGEVEKHIESATSKEIDIKVMLARYDERFDEAMKELRDLRVDLLSAVQGLNGNVKR